MEPQGQEGEANALPALAMTRARKVHTVKERSPRLRLATPQRLTLLCHLRSGFGHELEIAGRAHPHISWPGKRAARGDVLEDERGWSGPHAFRRTRLRHALPAGWDPAQRRVLVADHGRRERTFRGESAQSVPRRRSFGLVANADGSMDVYIQVTAPAAHESNWLPAPSGNFRLWLRAYMPGAVVLDGKYTVPPVVKTR